MKKVILVVPTKEQTYIGNIEKESLDCVFTIKEFDAYLKDGNNAIIDSKTIRLNSFNHEGVLYILEI